MYGEKYGIIVLDMLLFPRRGVINSFQINLPRDPLDKILLRGFRPFSFP